jgi:ubiquinone/menaquinone biosynthesis C-methylase UbiE
MDEQEYVHGYSEREERRLVDQATTLTDLLHRDTAYFEGDTVLEVGCGVGAQTVALARFSPQARIVSMDISLESIEIAKKRVAKGGYNNVTFHQSDLFHLPFPDDCFDHIFLCFVLEHIVMPREALDHLRAKLKTGGTITVIEGDHGSAYFHPESREASRTIQCLIDIQAAMKGNSLIGRQLYPLLYQSGFKDISVSPRMVYVDSSKPELVKGFTKNTFIAMVESVRDRAIAMNLIDAATWEKGIKDLYATTRQDGTFCYTFFKGLAVKGEIT